MTSSAKALPREKDGLTLNGAGRLRKGFIFNVYGRALYLDQKVAGTKDLSKMRNRIDLHYFHHTPEKNMLRAANKTLKKNLSKRDHEGRTAPIDQLHAVFLNGEKGRMASIIHPPGKGLQYLFNDQAIITIPGDDFANAYSSIWLGEYPNSPSIKNSMLTGMPQ